MRHSLVGRRCLSLFTTMVPAVPAPRTTRLFVEVVMLRRYPRGYVGRCERRDTAPVTPETKACLTRAFMDARRESASLEPPARDEAVEHVPGLGARAHPAGAEEACEALATG